jgi:two-component system, cell cycle sensor histidine kinase and response regulator CckA
MSLIQTALRPKPASVALPAAAPPRPSVGKVTPAPRAAFQLSLLARAHQQAAVAALGQAALHGVDLPTLADQAALFVSQTLSLDFSSVYELAEDGTTLRMIAGCGWNSGVVGNTEVSAQAGSMAAYVLGSSEPVIVRDTRSITAFQIPDFIRSHGVISGLSVVVPGSRKPWGILEAQCRRGRTFAEDDFHFLQAIANVLSSAHSRKQAEAEREHLATFVQHNPNPVVELDATGAVTYCNDAARIAMGALQKQSPSELLPPNIHDLVSRCLSEQQNVLNEQAEVGGRSLAWSFFPVPRTGRVHGYAIDVTERVNLEAQLRQSQKMEAIGQLAAGVAHDFNNILTIMQGLVRRLSLTASQEQNVMLEQMFETTERAASLTKQLLAFSRRTVLQRRVVSLGEIVTRMSTMLERLIGENIELLVESEENLPPIEADPATLEQIVMNLAVNARDAMPRGGHLLISTDSVLQSNEPGALSWVRLRVQDTGCGMSEEVKARIFEPFFTTKEIGKGTGLGLATVFGVVKQHGGSIEVESIEGQGTTFTILFPPTDKPLEGTTQFFAKQTLQRGAGETILLVEDEPILRELAHAILTDAGYKVLDAEHAGEAIDVWSRHEEEIALLVTDMMLPGSMTGHELARQLLERKPDLRVIYTTGYSQDLIEAEEAPIQFLQKPYPPETLMQTVRSCLDNTVAHGAGAAV